MAYLRLLVAQVAIGAAAIFARFALTGTGPLAASALRLAIAAAVVAGFSAVTGRLRRIGRRAETLLSLAGVLLAIHFAAWLTSLQYISIGVSTLLVCTSPIWTELYAWAIQRRPIRRSFVIALVLGALGLALVVTRRDVPAPIAGHALAGDMLALLGGMALAGYLLIVRGTRASVVAYRVRIVEIVTRTYSWAFAALAIAALFWHESPPPLGDGVAWFGILAMALVSQLIGHTALNAALTDFSPSTVAMSTLLEPVAAAVLAALIFHESATPVTALGGLCILAAIGFAATQTPEVPPTTYADSFSGEGTSAPGVMKQR